MGQAGQVAELDPDDDTLLRYVVWRYSYDPARHERCHQVVASPDNEAEFNALVDSLVRELRDGRDTNVTGAVPEITAEQVFMLLIVGWALPIFVCSAVLLTSNVPLRNVTLA